MTRVLVEYTNFGQMGVVADLTRVQIPPNSGNWDGTASSLEVGWNGVDQAVRGPSNLKFTIDASTYASVGIRGRVKIRASGSIEDIVKIQAGVAQEATFRRNAAGNLELLGMTGVSSVHTSTVPVTQDVWYEYEFAYYLHNTVGRWRVMWDNQEVSELTAINQDTIYSAASVLDAVLFHNGNIDIADPIVWADIGKFAADDFFSYPGRSVRIASLHPRAAGNYSAWTNQTNTGAEDWNEVDEAIHDGGTSFIHANTTPQRESFVMESLPTAPIITQVVSIRTQISHANDFVSAQGVSFLRYAGSNYDGVGGGTAGETGGNGTVWISDFFRAELWPVVPGTARKWEDEDPDDAVAVINLLEVGFNHTGSASAQTAISQVALLVLYISEPAPAPPVIQPGLVALRKLHRLVKTWLVQRTDGIEFAFTDHDRALTFDGVTFEPAGGFSGSAIRREMMLKDQSQEFLGVISSDAVTVDDLRAGRYRDATIVERIVDWRYPWLGDVQRAVYWIQEVQWNGKAWRVELGGIAQRLQRKRGIVVGRTCRWDLFGPGCLVNPAAHTFAGLGVSSVVDRYTFLATGIGTFADDWFVGGDIVWTAGANIGIVSEVRSYTDSNKRIEMYLRTPFPVTTSDTFTMRAGCDKLPGTCKTKFANFDNFGGFPFIPGRNKALRGQG